METLDWKKHKLESRLPGEISISSDMQMTPPLWQKVKRRRSDPWARKIPWRSKWQPIPVFLLGKAHGQRNLVGYIAKCHKESDTTE